jgi:hypothetical protein
MASDRAGNFLSGGDVAKITRSGFLKTLCAAPVLSVAGARAASVLPGPTQTPWLSPSLGSLPVLIDAESRQVSPENPTGEKGMGARAIPNPDDPNLPFSAAAANLGQGWKVSPFLKPKAGETIVIMDVEGPGVIEHIWMATETNWETNGRACVLRFYWDGEATPSIEVPMTDFFAVGNDRFAPVNSLPVVVNGTSALNCYWPMPFKRHAKITFTNELSRTLNLLTYQIDFMKTEVPDQVGYFHAQWRRAMTTRSAPVHTILDGVRGNGRYVGTFLAWAQLSDGWFGEGEVKFYIDGDKEFPTICGTGTEDYFGGSYGFPEVFSTAYTGNTLARAEDNGPRKWSLYRWHIMDPVSFRNDLRLEIQALGWWPNKTYQPLEDDIASVAYWYQVEPHAPFPQFPPLEARWPR